MNVADGECWPLLDGLLLKYGTRPGLLVRSIRINFGYKLTNSTRDVTERVVTYYYIFNLKLVSQWSRSGCQSSLEPVAPCCNKNTSFMSAEGILTYQNEADKEAARIFRASVHAKWDHAFRRLNKEKPGISGLMNFTEVCSLLS